MLTLTKDYGEKYYELEISSFQYRCNGVFAVVADDLVGHMD